MPKERLQKIIARAGLASRREAESWIKEGLVTVNGKVIHVGDQADPKKDAIKVKGKLLVPDTNDVYYLVYKPRAVIAMMSEDPEGRPTLKDMLKRIKDRVFPVGRMDFNGEGAILLTNDGDMAFDLQKNPDIVRRYRVKVDRLPSATDLEKLSRTARIAGRSMTPCFVAIVEKYKKNALVEIAFEGMGTIDIRKFIENKGLHAERITRFSIGHLTVSGMTPGSYRKLEKSQVLALIRQPELGMPNTKKKVRIKYRD